MATRHQQESFQVAKAEICRRHEKKHANYLRNLCSLYLYDDKRRFLKQDLELFVRECPNICGNAIQSLDSLIQIRWIYTVSVLRTFSSVFLRFCFSLKKYALFHPHFYKSIYALSRLLYIDKNFVQKFCVWTIRAIFWNRAVPLYKKFFSENFCPVCDCLVSADMDT